MAGLFKVVTTMTPPGASNNPIVNVFGYSSVLAVVNEEYELSNAFRTQVIPELAKVVSDIREFTRVEVYNVTNGTGYYDFNYVTPVPGLRTGDIQPFFTAWGFQYNRITAGKRNGAKRLGPISEADTSGTNPTPTMIGLLNTLAGVLGGSLTVGIIQTWFPIILERKPTGVYPWTYHSILNVQYKRITTQNSRKL